MRKIASLALSLFLLSGAAFADSPKDSPKNSPKDAPKGAAATPAKPAAANAATKTNAELAAQMEELRQALQAQQEQLQMLKEELAKRDRQIEEARETAASANARAAEANTKAVEAVTTSAEVKSTATALNSTVANMAASNAAVVNSTALATSGQQEEKGPTTIRYKGITLTPGGFVAAESSSRQRATGADVNTPFTGIPYPGNALSKASENNFTGRQSRVSMLAEGKISSAKLTGYVEADFLGAGVTSNNRQSNSYVLRQRQFWGRIDLDNGWAFGGGQMWSLAAENQKGIVNRGEWIPLTIDAQYQVGFNWARQYGLRVTKTFNDKFAIAGALEDSQATIGGRGFTTLTTTNESTAGASSVTNFFFNTPGAGGGLFNFSDTSGYTLNRIPDVLIKAAWDPGFGHYEVVGILSEFRSRVYPCAVASVALPCSVNGTTSSSAAGAFNDSRTGGGFEASARLPLFAKKLDASLKGGYGTGTGRYASAQLPDVTARPDGVLAPIHAANFLGRLEWHPSPKLDLYAYYGGEYAARAGYTGYTTIKTTVSPAIPGCGGTGQPACVGAPPGTIQYGVPSQTTVGAPTTSFGGYGNALANNSGCSTETAPGNTGPSGSGFPSGGGTCAGDIRYIAEGTLGFWHRIYQGEKGRVQWGIQYSYLYKIGWSGSNNGSATTVAPKAVDNMVFTSFRYYLP